MHASNIITLSREKLGISQQALADYLQVSRSLLSMVELGQRELPTQAFLQLTQLMSHYEAATPIQVSSEHIEQEKQQQLTLLEKLVKETRWQLAKLKQELAKMEEKYQQSLYQVQTFQTIAKQVDTDLQLPARERQKLWLAIQEEEAWHQADKNSALNRLPLQLKIVALQASLQEAQQLISNPL